MLFLFELKAEAHGNLGGMLTFDIGGEMGGVERCSIKQVWLTSALIFQLRCLRSRFFSFVNRHIGASSSRSFATSCRSDDQHDCINPKLYHQDQPPLHSHPLPPTMSNLLSKPQIELNHLPSTTSPAAATMLSASARRNAARTFSSSDSGFAEGDKGGRISIGL